MSRGGRENLGFIRRGGSEGAALPTLLLPGISLPGCQWLEQTGRRRGGSPRGAAGSRAPWPGGLVCGWAGAQPALAWLRGRGGQGALPKRSRRFARLQPHCSHFSSHPLPSAISASPVVNGELCGAVVPLVGWCAKLLAKLNSWWG